MFIVGLDLAWGERKRDAVCLIEANHRRACVRAIACTFGDEPLLAWFSANANLASALVMVDGPIVCPNASGSRPVDRMISKLFWRQHAGCYPANSTRCPRPARIAKRLVRLGYEIGWDIDAATRLVCEVYPHPAMIQMFGLDQIVKYKKGRVAIRRSEFSRLQDLLNSCLVEKFPKLELNYQARELLKERWSKPVEDKMDAFFCALIGYHHYLHHGKRSELFGNLQTGFILVPKPRA